MFIEEDINDWKEDFEDVLELYAEGNIHCGNLASCISDVHKAFALSIMGKRPTAMTQEFLEQMRDIGKAHFIFGTNPGKPISFTVGGKEFHTTGVRETAYMHVVFWNKIFFTTLISRDTEGMKMLQQLSDDIFATSNSGTDDFELAFVRVQRHIPHFNSELETLVDSALDNCVPEKMNSLQFKYRSVILVPFLKLYKAIIHKDSASFNQLLSEAIEAHRQFWSPAEKELKAEGWISLPLLAVCALACDQNIEITVESDYIPKFVYEK